jgi:hypothetical protein
MVLGGNLMVIVLMLKRKLAMIQMLQIGLFLLTLIMEIVILVKQWWEQLALIHPLQTIINLR